MSRRIAWHFALGCLLGAPQALAADHLAGSIDMQFYPYTCEVDSHAAWDFEPNPFTDPPPWVVSISGSHQISNVTGVDTFTSERDKYGNLFRFKGTVVVLQDSAFERVPAYDVFFQRVN